MKIHTQQARHKLKAIDKPNLLSIYKGRESVGIGMANHKPKVRPGPSGVAGTSSMKIKLDHLRAGKKVTLLYPMEVWV